MMSSLQNVTEETRVPRTKAHALWAVSDSERNLPAHYRGV